MKNITVKAYEFSELSTEAKETARNWYRAASCSDSYWSESIIEEAVDQGNLMGISFKERARTSMTGKPLPGAPCIHWSGFSSQGDGACFEGFWRASTVRAQAVADGWGEDASTTELKRIAAEFGRIANAFPEATFRVSNRGHYYHENCTDFDVTVHSEDEEGQQAEADLIEAAKDFMRWIYRRLESEYEYQNSDAAVDESIIANEYLFTESGSRCFTL